MSGTPHGTTRPTAHGTTRPTAHGTTRVGGRTARRRLAALALAVLAIPAAFAWGCAGPRHVTEPSVTGLPAGAAVRPHPWYTRAHHAGGTFRNLSPSLPRPSFARVAAWVITRRVLGRAFSRADETPTAVVPLSLSALRVRPERLRATWLGHATVYVQTPGLDLLLDPVFSDVVGPLPGVGPDRRTALPIPLDSLPGVDVVVVSHDHYDHFDRASVRRLAERFDPVFLVPLGLGPYVRAWGARRVAELDWWQYVDLPSGAGGSATVRFTCTPSVHNSGRRAGAFDRTLWAGWHVAEQGTAGPVRPLALFYAGDTGYGPHFAAVRERLGPPDIAVLPVGAYEPRSMTGAYHVTPEEALQAFVDLGGGERLAPGEARHALGVHWGTFELTDEPFDEPPLRLAAAADRAGLGARVHTLAVGGRFELGRDGRPLLHGSPLTSTQLHPHQILP